MTKSKAEERSSPLGETIKASSRAAATEMTAEMALEIIRDCRDILGLGKGESLIEAVRQLKLSQRAPCEICDGSGTVARHSFAFGPEDDQPCPECG